jgi:hypothetical protein
LFFFLFFSPFSFFVFVFWHGFWSLQLRTSFFSTSAVIHSSWNRTQNRCFLNKRKTHSYLNKKERIRNSILSLTTVITYAIFRYFSQ